MKVSIIGSGYVGLVTGTCLADVGNDVICFDLNADKINLLKDGIVPIYEPTLEGMIKKNIHSGRLRFTSDVKESVNHGHLQIIAVGTPPDEDGMADLSHVITAAENIAMHMGENKIIVNKSTVPVGTAKQVKQVVTSVLAKRSLNLDFDVVSNPEFLKEGSAIQDFLKPDRVIVGSNSEISRQVMKDLYAPFQKNHARMLFMDPESAELSKYAANAMLASRISFMNELARLAEALGADIEQVRIGIGSDPRIGFDFLYPGVGYGGSCFPKDVQALISLGQGMKCRLGVLEAVSLANSEQRKYFTSKIANYFNNDFKGKKIAVWGLAFKPNTDDLREAPSINILSYLAAKGASVNLYDPVAAENAKKVFPPSNTTVYFDSCEAALCDAEALVVFTEWQEFKAIDWDRVAGATKLSAIFDGRNIYSKEQFSKTGIKYFGIGR
ncbi:MAG: UDP-glucose/GDP-mannose dehydrogenase family protein [Bdellovibrionales bacterium]|nr:UDP-glucose/GDP-mannose dehydrogenase family protein [Bdellovibrionales bacterium]